jgi:hypothetical protein
LLRRGACSQYPKKNSESKQHAGRLGCHRVKLIAGPGAGRIQSFFQILIHVAVVRTPLVCVTTRRLRPVRARLPACLACLRASPKATAKKEHHSSTPARHEASLHRSSPCCVPARSVGQIRLAAVAVRERRDWCTGGEYDPCVPLRAARSRCHADVNVLVRQNSRPRTVQKNYTIKDPVFLFANTTVSKSSFFLLRSDGNKKKSQERRNLWRRGRAIHPQGPPLSFVSAVGGARTRGSRRRRDCS